MEQTGKEATREASEQVSNEFKTLVDAQDLDSLKQLQHLILGRLQDGNAVLSHFNEFSENCFAEVAGDFSRHTRLLRSMKSDLEYIFQKLRKIKVTHRKRTIQAEPCSPKWVGVGPSEFVCDIMDKL
ncbi:unnamed protein product [Prunus armeniaca]|uniref:KxDL domain-containing protein n=1 Tax=Prunus armeniaca TaxID=36596 RepID=A0A6J5UN08_PRUAR|nr:unnamed protein product [Prunus armeniaca]